MAVKDIAKEVIDQMPEGATMREIIYALFVRDQFDRGEREIREGRGLEQEEVQREAATWRK